MFANKICLFVVVLLFAGLTACTMEEMKTEVEAISGEEGANDEDVSDETNEEAVDRASCSIIDMTLVEELPVSSRTSANQYVDLSFEDWCRQNIVNDDIDNYVGNARAWTADETDPLITATSPTGRATRPTLAQGARLGIHVLDPQGTIPFVRKIHFSDWQGPEGTCALEMRVYQKDVGASGARPLLYFHGGGWRHRSTTMTAAEILTSHLVDEHVVFMPAYPLHDAKDGPAECRHADFNDILASAQQAFEWVVRNKDVFGATGAEQIDVMGHSAGGQLAAYIGTQNREQVGKLVNFYGPVEFADFIDGARPGGRYEDSFADSRALLASVLGVDTLADLQRPYDERVMDNSLSEQLAASGGGALPPFFMIQGNADKTVPVRQALLACNAIGGDANTDGGVFQCGNDSHVAILDNAGHNLDRRCAGGEWPEDDDPVSMMETVCPTAGGEDAAVEIAVRAAFDWLKE